MHNQNTWFVSPTVPFKYFCSVEALFSWASAQGLLASLLIFLLILGSLMSQHNLNSAITRPFLELEIACRPSFPARADHGRTASFGSGALAFSHEARLPRLWPWTFRPGKGLPLTGSCFLRPGIGPCKHGLCPSICGISFNKNRSGLPDPQVGLHTWNLHLQAGT